MRLVNADKLKEEFRLREDGRYYSSEPYFDYTLNEWKTRPVEHGKYDPISVVNEAPTIEAIPIEWLANFCYKCEKETQQLSEIRLAVETWRKENEISRHR